MVEKPACGAPTKDSAPDAAAVSAVAEWLFRVLDWTGKNEQAPPVAPNGMTT